MDYLVCSVVIGVGATAVMDLWTIARQRLLGIPPFDYGGIAASRTKRPGAARFQSIVTHAIFGLGLYAAGWAANLLRALI